jgi:hypothetical protein
MTTLTTNTYYGLPPPTPVVPPPPSITLPEPLSYEFQVVEYIQEDKVTKVALQIKQNIYELAIEAIKIINKD